MRLGFRAVPLLLALGACSPVRNVQAAAHSLTVAVTRVEPRIQLALPLDQSRLIIRITATVDNPSEVPFRVRGFTGWLALESPGDPIPVGQVVLAQPVELPPHDHAILSVEVSFTYQTLQAQWPALQATLAPGAAGAWILDGRLDAEAYGLGWQLPVHTRRAFGSQP